MQSHSRLMCGTCQTFVLWVLRVVQGSTGISYGPWARQWENQISVGKLLLFLSKFHTTSLKQAGKMSEWKMESRKGTLREWEQRHNACAQLGASQHSGGTSTPFVSI